MTRCVVTCDVLSAMSAHKQPVELSPVVLEIGRKLFPRRYQRHRGLRSFQEAQEWAKTLNWRNNPYDRFLLRRELLHHLESTKCDQPDCNVCLYATREQILEKIDYLLKQFPAKFDEMGVFNYVVVLLPFYLQRGGEENRCAGRQGRLTKGSSAGPP